MPALFARHNTSHYLRTMVLSLVLEPFLPERKTNLFRFLFAPVLLPDTLWHAGRLADPPVHQRIL